MEKTTGITKELEMTKEELLERVYVAVVNENFASSNNVNVTKKARGDIVFVMKAAIDKSRTLVVNESVLKKYNIDQEDLWKIAKKNTIKNAELSSMHDTLVDLLGSEENANIIEAAPIQPDMYVLTNHEKMNGAAAIMFPAVAKKVYKILGDFYILPSSIHEVICIPTSLGDVDELTSMVREVNDSEVEPDERLSYTVFKCENEKGTVSVA